MTMWAPPPLNPHKPKYQGLADAIAEAVGSGVLNPGLRLPTQRALADRLGVTVGTVTRAYAEAERRGLLDARVGSGTYVRRESHSETFRIPEPQPAVSDLGFTLPLDIGQHRYIRRTLEAVMGEPGRLEELLRYTPETGLERHREAARRWLAEDRIDCTTDDVLLCSGGQHGLFTALTALCRSGDTVLSDGLTYSGFILAARYLHLRHIGLPMDAEGMLPDELRTACERYRPRALYLMPQLHNPVGTRMTDERKREILRICEMFGVTVIEDNVQSCLLEHKSLPLAAMAPERVVVVSSCSKVLAGGIRVGFLSAPRYLKDRLRMALRVHSWMVSPLLAEVAARWIMAPERERMVQAQRSRLQKRHAMARRILGRYGYSGHEEALHGWLPMPGHWRALEFTRIMAEQDILLKAADVFAVGQFVAPQAVRLCLGAPLPDELLETVLGRIARVLDAEDAYCLQHNTI